jgi:GNAT superfamily N-acetyltransferase
MASLAADSKPSPFIRPYNPATDREAVAHIVSPFSSTSYLPYQLDTSHARGFPHSHDSRIKVPKTVLSQSAKRNKGLITPQCRETLPPALSHGRPAALAPHIWALPYVTLYPELCVVLDDGTGTAVGYILGTASGSDFVSRYHAEIVPTLRASPAMFPEPEAAAPPADWSIDPEAGMLQTLYAPDAEILHSDFPALLPAFPAHLHIDLLLPFQRAGWGSCLIQRFVELLKARGVRGLHLVMGENNVRIGAEHFYKRVGFRRYGEVLDSGQSGEVGRHTNGCVWMVKELDA